MDKPRLLSFRTGFLFNAWAGSRKSRGFPKLHAHPSPVLQNYSLEGNYGTTVVSYICVYVV
jgi:hypothetical protein